MIAGDHAAIKTTRRASRAAATTRAKANGAVDQFWASFLFRAG